VTAKPTVSELGIDLSAQVWRRSGQGDGAIEIAFARAPTPESPQAPDAPDSPESPGSGHWVLMRVTGDPEQRVLVFDRHEWECFLDGARRGEFDGAAGP
jgi:Domain of unknown function (DUF397)